jgi:hypothetical protein
MQPKNLGKFHIITIVTQLKEIKERLGAHDVQLNQVYGAWKICRMKKHRKEKCWQLSLIFG